MKKTLITLLILVPLFLACYEIEINLVGNPKWTKASYERYKTKQEVKEDSLGTKYYFAMGQLFKKNISDSLYVSRIDSLVNTIVTPTDFSFNENLKNMMISNVITDSLVMQKKIVINDSIKIGFFAIISPDLGVKNEYKNLKIYSHLTTIIKDVSKQLSKECEKVVFLSNMTKFVNKVVIKDSEVDYVFGFDYSKSSDATLTNGIQYNYLEKPRKLVIKGTEGQFSFKVK